MQIWERFCEVIWRIIHLCTSETEGSPTAISVEPKGFSVLCVLENIVMWSCAYSLWGSHSDKSIIENHRPSWSYYLSWQILIWGTFSTKYVEVVQMCSCTKWESAEGIVGRERHRWLCGASIRRKCQEGQAADTLGRERVDVVRDMVSDSLILGKLLIIRLRKSPLNLQVTKFSSF